MLASSQHTSFLPALRTRTHTHTHSHTRTHTQQDANNCGAISTDAIGLSDAWPTANHSARRALWAAHRRYTAGLLYFLANDPGVPARKRASMRRWGPVFLNQYNTS